MFPPQNSELNRPLCWFPLWAWNEVTALVSACADQRVHHFESFIILPTTKNEHDENSCAIGEVTETILSIAIVQNERYEIRQYSSFHHLVVLKT